MDLRVTQDERDHLERKDFRVLLEFKDLLDILGLVESRERMVSEA